jgi:membrane protease YdiL (CAAX protease family)
MTRSRNLHELIWGAFIGALFLWGSLSWHLDAEPNFAWIVQRWPMFFALCVASPVLEEYVFRGFLYEAVDARWPQAWPAGGRLPISSANAVTTFLFVIAHMIARDPVIAALVLLPSLYLGIVRQQSGGIGYCILIHSIWNIGWYSLFPLT